MKPNALIATPTQRKRTPNTLFVCSVLVVPVNTHSDAPLQKSSHGATGGERGWEMDD